MRPNGGKPGNLPHSVEDVAGDMNVVPVGPFPYPENITRERPILAAETGLSPAETGSAPASGSSGPGPRAFAPVLTAVVNVKGVIDVDTVKGCADGMGAYPGRGCYGLCYANEIAVRRGFRFGESVVRQVRGPAQLNAILRAIRQSGLPFLRIGTMGDPCYDWDVTLSHAALFARSGLAVVIVTKHWRPMSEEQLQKASAIPGLVINTSISPLDTADERAHRLGQYRRLEGSVKSVLRVVTCDFNEDNPKGRVYAATQRQLLSERSVIDNPLRAPFNYPLVKAGVMRVRRMGRQTISLHDNDVYLGTCKGCPEMCGVNL